LRYVSAASGGLPLTQVREAEAYAARASSELACVVCQWINQVTSNLGTQRQPCQTRRNQSPPSLANLAERAALCNPMCCKQVDGAHSSMTRRRLAAQGTRSRTRAG
jgi:hypothetical protein